MTPNNQERNQGENRECINGHKGTGIGFDDGCPECEAPWKNQPVTPEIHQVCDDCGLEANRLTRLKKYRQAYQSGVEEVREKLKHIAMYQYQDVEISRPRIVLCYAVQDVLDLLDLIRKDGN